MRLKVKLYMRGTTIETDHEAPLPDTIGARGIPGHPGEHTFKRWPKWDDADGAAYMVDDEVGV